MHAIYISMLCFLGRAMYYAQESNLDLHADDETQPFLCSFLHISAHELTKLKNLKNSAHVFFIIFHFCINF
jgi:hypothetical protein